MKTFGSFGRVALVAVAGACGGTHEDTHDAGARDAGTTSAIETAGTWESNFATTEVITNDRWDLAAIVSFDNVANVAITQTATDSPYFPGAFNRLVWTEIASDRFHYCIAVYGLATRRLAETSTVVPDATNPDVEGCSTFPWTRLTRVMR